MAKIRKGKSISLITGIGIGIATSIIVSVAAAAAAAALVNSERMDIGNLSPTTAVIHILASFLGGWLASSLTGQKKLICVLGTAAGYLVVMLAITALLFDGQYQGVGLTILMVLIGAGAVILLGLRGKNRGNRKHKIPAYR